MTVLTLTIVVKSDSTNEEEYNAHVLKSILLEAITINGRDDMIKNISLIIDNT